ncbi:hypothetical protein [Dinghuibacter silviterrae]|uniref:Uncharacterized protein n=1 Tax=Dinghuibacter silviterrae TaxID=1539049 RepID=A0A4R8DRJ5_9BACT|nr:hypothetical protein [Dinghuibacter silviterrae]TDX00456.1 hypothetical protein EDB95_1481 [Dinghuibacter silviterrae]
MENLFKVKNIGLQPLVDQDGLDVHMVYTEKLLSLNVLIEFYTAVIDDSEEGYEEETVIFAITYTKERSYTFSLFHSLNVVGPLQLYRTIADAIEFIERSSKDTLLADMEEISTGHTTSDIADNPRDRKKIYEDDVWKFKTTLDLIAERRTQR